MPADSMGNDVVADFDIVHAGDPRYRGGTASALRGEVAGARAWNLRTGFLPFLGQRGSIVQSYEEKLLAALQAAGIPFLTPDQPARCRILLAHHPQVFENMPDQPFALEAERVVLVLHHPPVDGLSHPQYNLPRVLRNLERSFGQPPWLAPISPVVRDQLSRMGIDRRLILPHDLTNVIELADWPLRSGPPPRNRAVLGRHARADPLKWPDTTDEIRAAWPDAPGIEVRILGEALLPSGMARPSNWTVLPFTDRGVSHFLRGLDFFVFFHSKAWVESFGLAVAEAMATGLVTILPDRFEPVFGPGAIYAQPHEVLGLIAHFMNRPDDYARQSRAARQLVAERYSVEAYKGRMQRLFADLDLPPPAPLRLQTDVAPATDRAVPARDPATPLSAPALAMGRRRILMLAGNGIGLGHITRLMAVAQHLPAGVEPVFLTLSLGTDLLRKAGFSADYIPSHTKAGVTPASWNDAFSVELLAMIEATGAQQVVFDGNDPFPGIVRVMDLRSDLGWIWLRRGLWQPHHTLNHENAARFDMIIEPEELAGDEDSGATRAAYWTERVPPVLLTLPADRLTRTEAAARMGLDPAACNVALQLGSQQNFDLSPVRASLLAALARRNVTVVEIANPLAPRPPDAAGIRQVSAYPVFPLSNIFDLMITTPGYNSFHECVFGGIPAIFVPNEAQEMDDQALRARFAQSAGLGLMLGRADSARAEAVLDRALSPDFAARLRARSAALSTPSGAAVIARLLTEFLISARADRPLAGFIPRG